MSLLGRRQQAADITSNVQTCKTCNGAGMVCGYKPEILPGACCVDYANAVCPECGGTGRQPETASDDSLTPGGV